MSSRSSSPPPQQHRHCDVPDDRQCAPVVVDIHRRRRCAISVEPTTQDDIDNFRLYPPPPPTDDRSALFDLMSSPSLAVLFGSLSDQQQRQAVVSAFRSVDVPAGHTFISKGDDISGFTVVRRGRLNIFASVDSSSSPSQTPQLFSSAVNAPPAGMRLVNSALAGDFVGDSALLVPMQAQTTIKASEDTSLWCLDRRMYHTIIVCLNTKEREELDAFINQLPLRPFSNLRSSAFAQLVSAAEHTRLQPYTRLSCDIANNKLYIIREGSIAVTQAPSFGGISTAGSFTLSSASTRPSLRSVGTSQSLEEICPKNAECGEEGIDRLNSLAGVDVVCTYSKGEWFAKMESKAEDGHEGDYSQMLIEGREVGGSRRMLDESSSYGLSTISEPCLLLSFDVKAFERAVGPIEQFIGEEGREPPG
eukprot:GHVS01093984.1.p1 GENE.GHVS01093984.1~~GHVS01093984.1.p1  ORF type:complete len:419 (+),score=78.34 GHVS01093984.1:340-1596(+)